MDMQHQTNGLSAHIWQSIYEGAQRLRGGRGVCSGCGQEDHDRFGMDVDAYVYPCVQ